MITASPDALSSLIQECQTVLKSAKLNTNTVRFNEDLSQMGKYLFQSSSEGIDSNQSAYSLINIFLDPNN